MFLFSFHPSQRLMGLFLIKFKKRMLVKRHFVERKMWNSFYFTKTNVYIKPFLFFLISIIFSKMWDCIFFCIYFLKLRFTYFFVWNRYIAVNDKNLEISFDQLKSNEQINQSEWRGQFNVVTSEVLHPTPSHPSIHPYTNTVQFRIKCLETNFLFILLIIRGRIPIK